MSKPMKYGTYAKKSLAGTLRRALSRWMFLGSILLLSQGCASNPTQDILNQCMSRYGSGRDSVDYWKCNLDNFGPYFVKTDPGNAAFWELYYRAQMGIWYKHENNEINYDKAKLMSLNLQDEASLEYSRRTKARVETEAAASQAFMQRMQGLAAFKEVIQK